MEYKRFYNEIENPLNEKTIDSILEAYTSKKGFYDSLVRVNSKYKEKNNYSEKDRNELYVYLYNEWKKSIYEQYKESRSNEMLHMIISRLYKYLSKHNPKTYQEVMNVTHGAYTTDEGLIRTLDYYSFTSLGEDTGWKHIDSSCVYYGTHKRQPIEHRLYLNCDSTVVDKIVFEIAKKCKKEGLRYYLKYSQIASRDDSLVIYSSTRNLPKFRRILNDVIRENNFQANVHKPPVLTGAIDGWIGYGTEPEKINGKKQSFNQKRESHLEKCILNTTGLWIKNNKDFQIRMGDRQISYKEYFVTHLAASFKQKLLRRIPCNPEMKEIYKYTEQEILTKEFDTELKNLIRNNFDAIIDSLTGCGPAVELKMDGKPIRIYYTDILESVKEQIKTISLISTTYKPALLKMIKLTSKDWQISQENYSIDIKGAEQLNSEDDKIMEEFTKNIQKQKKKQ